MEDRVKEHIEQLLKNHQHIRESVRSTRERLLAESRDSIIEALALGSANSDAPRILCTVDPEQKMQSIIGRYQGVLREANAEINDILAVLAIQEEEVDCLEREVYHLPEPCRRIILALHYEGKTWAELRTELGKNNRTIIMCRERALGILSERLRKKVDLLVPVGT